MRRFGNGRVLSRDQALPCVSRSFFPREIQTWGVGTSGVAWRHSRPVVVCWPPRATPRRPSGSVRKRFSVPPTARRPPMSSGPARLAWRHVPPLFSPRRVARAPQDGVRPVRGRRGAQRRADLARRAGCRNGDGGAALSRRPRLLQPACRGAVGRRGSRVGGGARRGPAPRDRRDRRTARGCGRLGPTRVPALQRRRAWPWRGLGLGRGVASTDGAPGLARCRRRCWR